MDKRRMNHIAAGFIVVMVLAIAFMFGNNLRGPGRLVLPDTSGADGQTGEEDGGSGALTLVQVTPQTVQTAIATLDRPVQYSRTVTVEQFWDGGSGTYDVSILVYGGWTRTDRTLPDGQVRHTLTDGTTTYVWYDDGPAVFSGAAAGISADNEQTIPTYEAVLELPVESITAADYRTISDVNCIYVEAEREGGVLRYWVSVDTGLLAAAERLEDGQTVYRMAGLSVDLTSPTAADMTLPDGTALVPEAAG